MEFLSQDFRRKTLQIRQMFKIMCEIERVSSLLFAVIWSVEKKRTVFGDAYILDPHVTMVLVLYLMTDIDCA